ncbi:2Fe-2S iron-sulfur cluster-binding protein [Litoribrevibacter euphylliae]|uniref:2Fe-2S iron-sulfur cluster-binding protein n=1 Tax=Litoribrevibacter euphylliae TaxID=1834034 RepID=A0ABV7HFS6_9GAMM
MMSKASNPETQFHTLKLADVNPLTDDSVMLTFDIPSKLKPHYQFVPGQYLTLRARIDGKLVSRCYSICSPQGEDKLSVAIRKISDGQFSAYAVENLAANDELEVMPPMGRFQLVPQTPKAEQASCYVGVAGGSGITPIMSMVNTVLKNEQDSQFVLFYANRSPDTMMFRDKLEVLKTQYPDRFFLLPFFSEDPSQQLTIHFAIADSLDGMIHSIDGTRSAKQTTEIRNMLSDIPDLTEASHWYLCGPQGMTDMVQNILLDNDVDESRIQRELFTAAVSESSATAGLKSASKSKSEETTPSAAGASADASQISVIHNGQSVDFDWDESNEVILNQALKQNEDLPHACQFGACGTCKAKVIEGSADMKENMSIEADEVEQGYILTCQAVPTSDRVVISYDE